MNLPLIKAIIILPGTALIFVPGLIMSFSGDAASHFTPLNPADLRLWIALVPLAIGLAFAMWTVRLFLQIGLGTPGTLGSTEETSCSRTLPTCPKPDDYINDFYTGRGISLVWIMANRRLDACLFYRQRDLFSHEGRAGSGTPVRRGLSAVQG